MFEGSRKAALLLAGLLAIGLYSASGAGDEPALQQRVTPEAAQAAITALFAPFPPAETGFQRHEPVRSVNPTDDDIPTLPLDKWVPLKPGYQVDVPEWPEETGTYYIQRLTENTWWVFADLFAMTLYVGEHEALIIDMPEFVVMNELFANIDDILRGKPLTTLVYSHPHMDHIGQAQAFVDRQNKAGVKVRIIGAETTKREILRYRQPVPLPTEILPSGRSTFTFDDKKFIYATPVDWAHTGADAYILSPDGVAHAIDMFYGNRLPLHDYSGVQNMDGWIKFLRHLAGEEWTFVNIGHVNIANRQGLMRSLEYTEDLYNAWFEVAPKYWSRDYFPHGQSYIATFLRNLFDKISYDVALLMKPKWGHLPHWTLAHDHAMKVQWDMFLNYRYLERPDIRPSFDPISPEEGEK